MTFGTRRAARAVPKRIVNNFSLYFSVNLS